MSRQSKRLQAREERREAREERRPQRVEEAARAEAPRAERHEPVRERTRTPPLEYLREVRQELRKVAWPSRQEVVSYTVVVVVATAALMLLVFGMDFVFGRLVFAIFENS